MRPVCQKPPYLPYPNPNPIKALLKSSRKKPAPLPTCRILPRSRRKEGPPGLRPGVRREWRSGGPVPVCRRKAGDARGLIGMIGCQGCGGYASGPGTVSQERPARQGRCGKALNIATRRKLLKTLHAERQPSSKRYFLISPGEGPALRPPFHTAAGPARGACGCPPPPEPGFPPEIPVSARFCRAKFLYKHHSGTTGIGRLPKA